MEQPQPTNPNPNPNTITNEEPEREPERVGMGAFSEVFRRYAHDNTCPVAVKCISSVSHASRMMREATFLHQLQGKDYCVPILSVELNDNSSNLVLPYVPHRSFKETFASMTLPEVQQYMRALLTALNALHTQKPPIIHRDIKPSNFLRLECPASCTPATCKCSPNFFFSKDKPIPPFALVDFGLAHLCKSSDRERNRLKPHRSSESNKRKAESSLESAVRKHRGVALVDMAQRVGREMGTTMRPIKSSATNSLAMSNASRRSRLLNANATMPSSPATDLSAKSHSTAHLRPPMPHTPQVGTRGFRSPEILTGSHEPSTAADIWAAGVIFLCILTRRYPFFTSSDPLDSLAELMATFGHVSMSGLEILMETPEYFPNSRSIRGQILPLSPKQNSGKSAQGAIYDNQDSENIRPPVNGEHNPDRDVDDIFHRFRWLCKVDWAEYCYLSTGVVWPKEAFKLLEQMLTIKPTDRITAADALHHDFLTSNYLTCEHCLEKWLLQNEKQQLWDSRRIERERISASIRSARYAAQNAMSSPSPSPSPSPALFLSVVSNASFPSLPSFDSPTMT